MTVPGSTRPEYVSWPHVAKGASRGFTVLVAGGVATPLMSQIPLIGVAWLIIVAVAAFGLAGAVARAGQQPAVHGALAALGSYLLVLPLVALSSGLHIQQLLLTSATALVIGGISAHASLLFQRAR